MTQASDEDLARRALAGDPAAFESLLIRHQERVYRLARRLTRSDADAQEAVQETFVIVLRKLRAFRGDATFATWLFRIATNAALGQNRGRSRRPAEPLDAFLPRFDRDGRHASAWTASGETPEAALDRSRLTRRAARSLDRLPERYRTPFVLRDLEEMPTAEVATILKLTVATVRQRVHRARLMLQGYLEDPVGKRSGGSR